ncbi:helix-turn-helix transcriptional regulator [Morganella morganii]|uniref:helix-turn-helix transcriptional regulator n=1 Tax=Morganella morganii TaxID=582 RepID=UPI003D7FB17C
MMSDYTLLRVRDVMKKTSFKRSWVYVQMERGKFPRPVRIGGRSIAWVESEVNEWIASHIKKREGARK